MTSLLRSVSQVKEGLTRFLKPESPCYDNGDNVVLFPFTYNNGVLDITYAGNNFKALMVDTVGVAPNPEEESGESDTAVRIMSGPYLVNTLGSNFKSYIRAWRDGIIDAGSPIDIYIAPQMLRVQEADINNVDASSGDAYNISAIAPSSENYIAGDETTTYNTTYVFKTPLTFTIVESGVTQYITFRTVLDQE